MKVCIIDIRAGSYQVDMVFNNTYPGISASEYAFNIAKDVYLADIIVVLTNKIEDFEKYHECKVFFTAVLPSDEYGLAGIRDVFNMISNNAVLDGLDGEVVILRPGVSVISGDSLQEALALHAKNLSKVTANCEKLDGGRHPSWLYLANNLAEKQIYRIGPTPLFNLVNRENVFDKQDVLFFPTMNEIVGSQFLPNLYAITGSILVCTVSLAQSLSVVNEDSLVLYQQEEFVSPVFVYNLPVFTAPA